MGHEQWTSNHRGEPQFNSDVEKSAQHLESLANDFWSGKDQEQAQYGFQGELSSLQDKGKDFTHQVFDRVKTDMNSKSSAYLPDVSVVDDGTNLELRFTPGAVEGTADLLFHHKGMEATVSQNKVQTYFTDYSSYREFHGYSKSMLLIGSN